MSMSVADATLFTRSLIKEPTAIFWSDAEITLYLTMAMQSLWSKYSNNLYEIKKSWLTISLLDGVADYNVDATCYKISKILVTSSGNKLSYVFDDELFKYADAVPAAATNYLTYYFLPKFADITSFPDVLQPLVCVTAIIFAKSKDESVGQDLLDLRAWYEDSVKFEFASHNLAEPSVFPDFSEEESLGSEYAWTYKAGAIHLLESANA